MRQTLNPRLGKKKLEPMNGIPTTKEGPPILHVGELWLGKGWKDDMNSGETKQGR